MRLTIELQDLGKYEAGLLQRVWDADPTPVCVTDLVNEKASADECVAFDHLVNWGLLLQHADAHARMGVTISRIGKSVLDALARS